jgi:hypothetical protein
MERRKAKRTGMGKGASGYPGLRDAWMDRKAFLSLVSRSILGVSVAGVMGCDEGNKLPVDGDLQSADGVWDNWVHAGIAPRMDVEEDSESSPDVRPDWLEFVTAGVDVPPDEFVLGGEDVGDLEARFPDVKPDPDGRDDDWTMGGVPRPPEDIIDEESIPLPGEMPEPDVIDIKDKDGEDEKDAEEDFFIGGIMPPPEEEM